MIDSLPITFQIEGNNICFLFCILASIYMNGCGVMFLFELFIHFLEETIENFLISSLPFLYELVANCLCEKLKRKGCSIESNKRRSSWYFCFKSILMILNIRFFISFNELYCTSTRECWFLRDYIAISNKHTTAFCSSQVLMRAKKCKINLI